MMEAENTPKNERFVCKHCQKSGGWLETHNICELDYINNYRSTECQCDNIGHGWNVSVAYDKPVSDEDFEDYTSVNNKLPKAHLVEHRDSNRIDVVAKLLVDHYKFVTAKESEIIYYFNGKIYDSKSVLATIKEETEQLIKECTKHDKIEVIDKIKSMTYTDIENFDSNPDIVTCENGVFNIRTQELTPHTPDNLSTILIPCRYDVADFKVAENLIEDTKFWNTLESTCTLNDKLDEEMKLSILEMMASCFIKQQIDEKAFMLLGSGSNGKSVVLEFLVSLLGDDNVSRIPLQDLSDKPFAAANLEHKLANIFTDIEATELKKSGKIKTIVSGEGMYVEYKHQNGFTLMPFVKLIFSSNRFPKVYDQQPAFFRRWNVIEFPRKFVSGDPARIEGLKDLLIKDELERDIVFAYLLGVAKELLVNQKFTISRPVNEIKQLWNANADPVNNFVENYIIDVDDGWKSKRETYAFYKRIMYEQGENPLDFRIFNKAFAQYFDESKSGSVRTWQNIDFKEPKQESFKEFDE